MSFSLKTTHTSVKAYYETLQQFGELHVGHEGAVRSAFQTLLAKCGQKANPKLTLVPEYRIERARSSVVVDGALVDLYHLPHGYWEGHTVFATMRDPGCRNAKNASAIRTLAEKDSLPIYVLEVDVTNDASVKRAVDATWPKPVASTSPSTTQAMSSRGWQKLSPPNKRSVSWNRASAHAKPAQQLMHISSGAGRNLALCNRGVHRGGVSSPSNGGSQCAYLNS